MSIHSEPYGTFEGRAVRLHTLDNGRMTVRITDYGGIITHILLPGQDGRSVDVVLGYDRLEDYLTDTLHLGAIVGRCANRIAGGAFTLDGQTYHLPLNEAGRTHLHGGSRGFHRCLWESSAEGTGPDERLVLERISPHLEEGYPGEAHVRAEYRLDGDNALWLTFRVETDRPTPVNLAGHSYFNLAGHDTGEVTGHEMTINAEFFTPTDENLIPTGEICPAAGGPYDFRRPRILEEALSGTPGRAIDHNYVLSGQTGGLVRAAVMRDPGFGRTLTVLTDAPGLQFYTGHFIPEGTVGKGGRPYGPRGGLCLETQGFPNAVNTPAFPSVVLRPGETYRHTLVYAFTF